MKKKIIGILAIGLLCAIFFGTGMVAGASSSAPGTTGDPLITQSYLEKRLSELLEEDSKTAQPAAYKKVSVTKGKKLTMKEGCEFIVYSGEAQLFGSKGAIDVTDGTLTASGKKTTIYHNYVTTSDSSGVTATANCIIYVKGSYVIE